MTSKTFFDFLAKYYDFFVGRWLGRTQKDVLLRVKVKENSRVLDVGCGTGNLLSLLLKEGKNLDLHGIDVSPKMLAVSRKKLGEKAELRLLPAEDIDFGAGSFDYVFSTDAFHHFANHESAVSNFKRILKSGGKLVILDFDFGKFLNKLLHYIEPANHKFFTKEELRELLQKQGFKILGQTKEGPFSFLTIAERSY